MVNAAAREPGVKRVYDLLAEVCDPEIPVINIVEMGILRDVTLDRASFTIKISPTYSGCPAMDRIREDITEALNANGIKDFQLETVLSPAWTTDMMWISAKEKLKNYGIAPPCLAGGPGPVCPQCSSADVRELSYFSSTACKSLYQCLACKEPFEYFKPH